MLKNLQIQRFRGFADLSVGRLGRVNLIVGRNNVGKTSLLEALWLYCRFADSSVLRSILTSRDELLKPGQTDGEVDLLKVFYGRPSQPVGASARVGPSDSEKDVMTITAERLNDAPRGFGSSTVADRPLALRFSRNGIDDLSWQQRPGSFFNTGTGAASRINCQYVPAGGLEPEELADLWNSIVLRVGELDVVAALQIIEPKTERCSLIATPGHARSRIVLVKLRNEPEPLPLRVLGDGMNRLFGIALALVNSQDGMLLLDEAENGIHFTAQEDLWKLIFETASKLNVQVFAATHSWDCVEGFQTAAAAHPDDGVLVRLFHHNGQIRSFTFDEESLGILTRDKLEMRW